MATFGGRRVPLGGEWPPHPFHRKTGNPEMEKLLFYYDFGCTVALNAHNLSKRDIGLTSSQRRQRARERRASHGVGLGRGRPDDEDVDDDSAYDSMSDGEAHDRPTITHEMVYEGVSRVIAQMKDMSLPACDAGHFNQCQGVLSELAKDRCGRSDCLEPVINKHTKMSFYLLDMGMDDFNIFGINLCVSFQDE